jgi:hypothetical protein
MAYCCFLIADYGSKKGRELSSMARIDLAQNREHWRFPANTAINIQGSIKCWEVFE